VLGYEYHPEAQAEYLAEVEYYSRVSAELGLRFVTEVEAAMARARLDQLGHVLLVLDNVSALALLGHQQTQALRTELRTGVQSPAQVGATPVADQPVEPLRGQSIVVTSAPRK